MRQKALITGATSGIGEACARKFAEGGYDIIITGRKAERLEKFKSELEAVSAGVKVLLFDVQIAEVLVLATHQANGTVIVRE